MPIEQKDVNAYTDTISSSTAISTNPPHNDCRVEVSATISFSGDTVLFEEHYPVNFPRFQEATPKIYVPSKTQRVIEQRVSDERMRRINEDVSLARELSLIILSNLSNTFYQQDQEGWKRLKAEYMRDQVSFNLDSTYRKILEMLKEGTANGPIIQEVKDYIIGKQSNRYRLSDVYRNKGVVSYQLQTDQALQLRRRAFHQALRQALKSTIAKNCISCYEQIEVPTHDQVTQHGRRLAKEGFTNKKGMILTYQGKHNKAEWVNPDQRVWLEEQVDLYDKLIDGGFLVPQITGIKGGGRVVDTFTLMPSWIRSMVKMNGKFTREYDFSCLHPNIASKLFGGTGEHISHQQIADFLGIDITKAKVANLSFFNAPFDQMKSSVLWPYYEQKEPTLLSNLLTHRAQSGLDHKDMHKATSAAMFKAEVELMTHVIHQLNQQDIYPIYVYDALCHNERYQDVIIDVMNSSASILNINTTAKP